MKQATAKTVSRKRPLKGHIKEACWIAADPDIATPRISRRFTLAEAPTAAVIEVTGLGYFELYCNDCRVGNDVFVPAASDYCKRDLSSLTYPINDTFTHRTYYLKYDVTDLLQAGENTLEIVLGNGWFRQTERIAEGRMSYGEALCAIYAVTVQTADGKETVLLSDGSERCTPTDIVSSNLFLGEHRIFGSAANAPSRAVQKIEMDTILTEQKCPPDRIIRTIAPTLLWERAGVRLYDAGEVVSGWALLHVKDAFAKITVRYSEELNADGQPDYGSTGGHHVCAGGEHQIQRDIFETNGGELALYPHFSWHAFRYFTVESEGTPLGDCLQTLCVEVVHSDVAETSSFESDSEALNWLYDAYIRTQLDNMHGSFPSDCPHRERLGYTGDGQVTCDAAMLLLDSRSFYEKWIRDILDCQCVETGHVQHTAPFMGGGGGPCGWGGAIVEVPYQYYRHFGGTDKLLQWYPAMRKYISYILSRCENDLVVREEEGGWCLGDWASMGKMTLPEPYVNSCLFLRFLREMGEIARLLGLNADSDTYAAHFARVRDAVIRTYYNEQTGSFCDGTQAADAFALDVDIAPDGRALGNLTAYYRSLGYLDTGFIGTDLLFDVLFRAGETDLAYALLTTEQMGGYLWMKRQGATTIYEYLNGACSHCHPMFGSPVKFLFRHMLGICKHFITEIPRVEERIRIAPMIPRAARHMSGSIATAQGDISVSWKREGESIEINVGVPEGIRATFAFGGMETELHPGESCFVFHGRNTDL